MAARAKGTGQAKRTGPKPPAAARARSAAPAPAKPKAPPAPPEPQPEPQPEPATRRPAALRLAAVAQVIEAAGLCVAAAFGAVSTADGKSSRVASGVAVTVTAVIAAVGIALIAVALAKARPWTRTPTVMTQLFVVIGGIVLLDGNRPEWGVPGLVLAGACMAGLLTPASLRALNRPPSETSSVKSR